VWLKVQCKFDSKLRRNKAISDESKVEMIDEYNTSKLCYQCEEKLEPAKHWKKHHKTKKYGFYATHGVRVCTSEACTQNKKFDDCLKQDKKLTLTVDKYENSSVPTGAPKGRRNRGLVLNRDVNAAINIRNNYVLGTTLR